MNDRAFKARITLAEPVNQMTAGTRRRILVAVKNISPETWPGPPQSGEKAIRLANHWRDANNRVITQDDARADLPRDLKPNEEITLPLTVTVPGAAGRFRLELDMVQEQVAWFSTKGSQALFTDVDVAADTTPQPDARERACRNFLARYAGASHPEFLTAACEFFFGRGWNEARYNASLVKLYAGYDRARLMQDFIESAEFQAMANDPDFALADVGPAPDPAPLPPRSSLEQYQDIWVRGKLERKGVRECEDRFALIREFAQNYQRPFTVLDIGANLGYFSLRLAETFDCVCVAAEGVYGEWIEEVLHRNENPRVILLKRIFKLADLRALAEVEHFDIVLGLSVIHHLDGSFDESLDVLRSLGDHLILELPFEPNACGQQVVRAAARAELPSDTVLMGFGKSHLAAGERQIVRLSRPKTSIAKSHLGSPCADTALTIHSDFTSKSVKVHSRPESRPWREGINLQTYLWFNGAYPSRPQITQALERREPILQQHRKIQAWDIILQGHDVQVIDSGNPNHVFSYLDRQYVERLRSLLRAETLGASAMDKKETSEYHLFTIWETARGREAAILKDIRQKFEILAVHEVRWSAARVNDNFTRLFGQKPPPGSSHVERCGAGPFLAVVVHDKSPRYEIRQTAKGQRRVNVNTFDARQRYRQWTGGGQRVDATETEGETRHDVALLFGTTPADFIASRPPTWDGRVETLNSDLAGANGWRDLREFFVVLNNTIRYIVLRNFEGLPGDRETQQDGDIDILTDAPDEEVAFVVNGEKAHSHYIVPIAGQKLLFVFRHASEGYFDPRWQKDMLSRRVLLPSGVYAPAAEDHFYSLLAHSLLHKPGVAARNVSQLRQLGAELGLEWARDLSFANPRVWRGALEYWLREGGYGIVRPVDASVFFNEAIVEGNFEWEAIQGGLPLVRGLEQLISARMLVEHKGKCHLSFVFHNADSAGVIKQATGDLALRDAKFLRQLTGPFFPRAISAEQRDGWSVAEIERIEGESLQHAAKEIARTPERLTQFFDDCLDLLAQLQEAGITHRDIRADNLIVRDGRPVLIDFGWAISNEQPIWTPSGLGQDGCPADGIFCDVFAMGKVFEKLLMDGHHAFAALLAAMTAQDRAMRATNIPALKLLLQSQPLQSDSPAMHAHSESNHDGTTIRAVPTVSVIIPVLNKIDLTRKCLDALRQNTPAGLCEVIVWDNASTDSTRAFFQQRSPANAGVRYFRSEENLGFVGGNNTAAQHARGRFLVFLNNDTEPRPGWLEALLQTAESDPSIGAVGAKLIYPDGKLQEAGGVIFQDASGWNYGRMQDPRNPRFNFPREVDYCSAACMLVRAELFRSLGGFDARYAPAYYEDTDLCFALRQAGYKVLYQPRCEIIHHEGATAGQDLNKGFKRHQVINRQKFFDKWREVLAKQHPPVPGLERRASNRARGQRILVVDPLMPMYDRASGSKRLFEILKLLAKGGHAVTFIARNGQNGERYAAELEQLGVEVYAGDAERMKDYGFTVNSWPLDLKKLLQDSHYDTVILSFWYIAEQYLPLVRAWSPTSRVVIDTVDVHFVRERRQAELYQDQKLHKQAAVTYQRELRIYRQADALITVTEDDRQTLLGELPESRLFVVPNIHDLPQDVPPADNRAGLLFVGGFAHPPNEDAVLYFHREIWPRVCHLVPGARWTIVGNKPPASVQALAGGAIQVTGYVPSVEPYLRSHLVSIAPLRYGAGMKGKIGEALAYGLPVVTTSIGAEGMSLKSGDGGALVSDDPETFAAHVAKLYADCELWNQLSAQGRRHIESHFTPECIGRQIETLLDWSASFSSIIVLAHNQWEHTKECLQSIAHHTPEPHEIIMVDNGSSDKTPDALRALAFKNPRVRVIINRDNRGFAAGNNQGLALARGKHVVLLNNDTVVTPGWLTRLLSVLKRHPETGIVGPMSNQVSGPQFVKDAGYTDLATLPAFAESWAAANDGQSIELVRAVGFCLLARREVIKQIGGLDERFGSGNFEDDDFCIRAQLAGFRIRAAKDAFVHHVGGQTFKGAKINYRASMLRNWDLFKKKWAMPVDLAIEKGYRLPTTPPADGELRVPLPDLQNSHASMLEGRLWRAKSSKPTIRIKPAKAAPIQLPPCALLGDLRAARELLNKKQHRAAWDATLAALQVRPFHPEADLLLAQIAQAAGAGDAARHYAQRASDLVPQWNPAAQFLKGTHRGQMKPDWLALPASPPAAPRLTVCLIVKNEEQFLGQCLASVGDVASQIIVVDTGSTDRTVAIAKEHGAEVHQFAWCDDFSAARNAALEHATGDWILSLDADEELLAEHKETIRREMRNADALAYRIPIVDTGREQEGCSYVPRLFRNAPGLFFVGRVHEQVFSSILVRCQQWGLKNTLGQTTLLHHGYSSEVVSSRNKIERNLRLLEVAIEELPGEPSLLMNHGLELVRSGELQAGLDQYVEALRCLGELPPSEVTPELRETLLTQLTSHLLAAKCFDDIVKLWQAPVAKAAEMTASNHFGLGLAYFELKRPAEAAEHMRQCVAKRGRPVLTPVNKTILKSAPNHCLALALMALRQAAAAEDAFLAALAEEPQSRSVRFDFARFQVEGNQPLEALKLLNQLVADDPGELRVWQFGAQIALGRPEFVEFARDWTGEAFKNCSQDPTIILQRAEALLLNQDVEQALPLWIKAHSPKSARHLAALVLCECVTGICGRSFSPADEPLVSQEFQKWYLRLINSRANSLVYQLNESMEKVRLVLPTFTTVLERATSRNQSGQTASAVPA